MSCEKLVDSLNRPYCFTVCRHWLEQNPWNPWEIVIYRAQLAISVKSGGNPDRPDRLVSTSDFLSLLRTRHGVDGTNQYFYILNILLFEIFCRIVFVLFGYFSFVDVDQASGKISTDLTTRDLAS